MAGINPKISAAAILAALLTGCASGPQSSPDAPAVTLVSDNRVILDSAVVLVDHGALDISGAVHIRPGYSGPIAGRVDIEYVSPQGDLLDGLPVGLDPGKVSSAKPSTFHVNYMYIPPKGSVLRIRFVDAEAQAREDLEGGFFDAGLNGTGGTGGGNAGGGGAAGRGGSGGGHYNNGHTMGYGSNFGSHNFGPGGHK
jgi:hypothetical protein